MKDYTYETQRTCAKVINFSVDEEGRLHNVNFVGGCPGNLPAIGKLVEGQDAKKVADILRGNPCGARGTSCADQLALAIDKNVN